MKKRVGILTMAALLLLDVAYGQEISQSGAPTWAYSTFKNQYSSGEAVKTDVDGLPGNVSFSCTDKGGLHVSVWRGPKAATHGKPRRVKRRETSKGRLYVNDVKLKKVRWFYSDGIPAISAANAVTKAALYNAVVRGDNVILIFKKETPVSLMLPPPNTAFEKFGAKCGLAKIS